MRPRFCRFLFWLWLCLGAGAGWSQAAPPPLSTFFEEAGIASMQLSPSGRWMAAQSRADNGGNLRLVVVDLQDKEPSRVVAGFSRANVRSFHWVNDELLIFSVREDQHRGVDSRYTGLMSVRRDGEGLRLLIKTEFESLFPATGMQPLEPNNYFLHLGTPGSDEIIVGESQFDADFEVRAVKPIVLNARNGIRRSLMPDEPPNTVGWLFDHLGKARLATTRKGDNYTYLWRDSQTKAWKKLADFTTLAVPFTPVAVDAEDTLYVRTSSADGRSESLHRFNFETGKPEAEAMVEIPGYSGATTALIDRNSGLLTGLGVRTDAYQQVWLEASAKAMQAKVDAMLPGKVNTFFCRACMQQENLLVHSYSDRSPGEYLLYKPKTDDWQRLGLRHPKVAAAAMSPLQFHRIKARDGEDLPVWVTLPAQGKAEARAAVVLVHGGPWQRGREWEWDDQAQFLASRGYVVIEPEFRGSTGYGYQHFRNGFRQWGMAMQDDISDALQFAVRKQWVDPKRVCIAGASYGGYATLMGLAKDPDQYRCGVAWLAVSDPALLFSIYWSDIDDETKRYSMKEMIGDPVADAALFKANSPLAQADRIKAPVMLAYGGKDRRVPIDHGEKMRAALSRSGQAPEWVVYPDEGHGWNREATRLDFWKRVETFLGKHLAP